MNNQQENDSQPTEQDNLLKTPEETTMQTKAEFEQEKKRDRTTEDNTVASSDVDNQQLKSGAAGTDRAGTAERKTYGDTELNKGLEAQAKDEES